MEVAVEVAVAVDVAVAVEVAEGAGWQAAHLRDQPLEPFHIRLHHPILLPHLRDRARSG